MKNKNIPVRKVLFIFILSVGLIFPSCKEKPKQVNNQTEITFTKEGELSLFSKPSDSLIKQLDIEIADNEYERETGLMHRSSMKNNQGMLFIFKNSQPRYFYMKNTHIPLDIIYLSSDMKIVSFQNDAKPMNETSLPSNASAQYVLEINGGLATQWNLKVGDSISFTKN